MSSKTPKTEVAHSQQRPEAAVFLEIQEVSLASNFQLLSKAFLIENQDLLLEGHGVVAQFLGEGISSTAITLIFDARNQSANHYMWELTAGKNGAREIWQIDSFPEEVYAKRYRTSRQGLLQGQTTIGDEETQRLYCVLEHMLDSADTKQQIDEKRTKKQRAEEALAEITLAMNLPENSEVGMYQMQHQQFQRLYRHQGFTALIPFLPPKDQKQEL